MEEESEVTDLLEDIDSIIYELHTLEKKRYLLDTKFIVYVWIAILFFATKEHKNHPMSLITYAIVGKILEKYGI
jgi:hypothetical protein